MPPRSIAPALPALGIEANRPGASVPLGVIGAIGPNPNPRPTPLSMREREPFQGPPCYVDQWRLFASAMPFLPFAQRKLFSPVPATYSGGSFLLAVCTPAWLPKKKI